MMLRVLPPPSRVSFFLSLLSLLFLLLSSSCAPDPSSQLPSSLSSTPPLPLSSSGFSTRPSPSLSLLPSSFSFQLSLLPSRVPDGSAPPFSFLSCHRPSLFQLCCPPSLLSSNSIAVCRAAPATIELAVPPPRAPASCHLPSASRCHRLSRQAPVRPTANTSCHRFLSSVAVQLLPSSCHRFFPDELRPITSSCRRRSASFNEPPSSSPPPSLSVTSAFHRHRRCQPLPFCLFCVNLFFPPIFCIISLIKLSVFKCRM